MHQRMAQVGTWWQFSILGGWNGRRRYNTVLTCGFESAIDALNSYGQLLLDKDIAIIIVFIFTILQNKQKVPCLSRWIHEIQDE